MANPDILTEIRTACSHVVRQASHVRVNFAAIDTYAASLPISAAKPPEVDPRDNYVATPDHLVAFVLTLDSINFGSGYFPEVKKRPGMSGYFTFASALREFFECGGPPTPSQLQSLTALKCAEIFDQDLNNPAIAELMQLYRDALGQLGTLICEDYDGDFCGPVREADGSAKRLISILARMPYFRDIAHYKGFPVPLYKRAQLCVADLAIRLKGTEYGTFGDLRELTMFADNAVPNVLRVDGILEYTDALRDCIAEGDLLAPDSVEEVEIRASALYAVELITESMCRIGRDATPMTIDMFLWNRGQDVKYKAVPRHRTRTIFY